MKLRIYNLIGTLVTEQDLVENRKNIDVSMLSNGIYVLSVSSDKFIGNQRMIIQR